jgi:hypothetical protein
MQLPLAFSSRLLKLLQNRSEFRSDIIVILQRLGACRIVGRTLVTLNCIAGSAASCSLLLAWRHFVLLLNIVIILVVIDLSSFVTENLCAPVQLGR